MTIKFIDLNDLKFVDSEDLIFIDSILCLGRGFRSYWYQRTEYVDTWCWSLKIDAEDNDVGGLLMSLVFDTKVQIDVEG